MEVSHSLDYCTSYSSSFQNHHNCLRLCFLFSAQLFTIRLLMFSSPSFRFSLIYASVFGIAGPEGVVLTVEPGDILEPEVVFELEGIFGPLAVFETETAFEPQDIFEPRIAFEPEDIF